MPARTTVAPAGTYGTGPMSSAYLSRMAKKSCSAKRGIGSPARVAGSASRWRCHAPSMACTCHAVSEGREWMRISLDPSSSGRTSHRIVVPKKSGTFRQAGTSQVSSSTLSGSTRRTFPYTVAGPLGWIWITTLPPSASSSSSTGPPSQPSGRFRRGSSPFPLLPRESVGFKWEQRAARLKAAGCGPPDRSHQFLQARETRSESRVAAVLDRDKRDVGVENPVIERGRGPGDHRGVEIHGWKQAARVEAICLVQRGAQAGPGDRREVLAL